MLNLALNEEQQNIERRFSRQEKVLGTIFFCVVVSLISSTLFFAISWMWDDQRLPLSKIVLQGKLEFVTADDVQIALGKIDHIGTFMSQDIDVLQQSVESIPWVAHAAIRKQWPETIKVFLTEHTPIAIWNGQELLDENGLVFDGDIGLLKEENVKLYGPHQTETEVLRTYREFHPRFQKLGLSISSLVLNERRAWQIILDNGIRLELGKESLNERIERFFLLYNKLGSDTQRISYIDLRYDTGAAVGWFPEHELGQERTND
ncbi:cell division protein FtsQ [Vibrio azureus]|uniref:Cell division protein FtsQ n=1 Tax=Vibrio azureus NBRC 104587 TaxID=1219077 RepID=U3AQV8_9VIBR|nr:cell division protein FtsQ/DivIB [Vibrio azureus]AUI85289.1 cell division protein FtsQ [Vibrio azureus]GAD76145.1 cell division protein FtsQ [Vibrio azureus NBRC 104587]